MATVMIADKDTSGVYLKRGAKNNKTSIMQIDMITLDIAVLHPASKLTADLEKGPVRKVRIQGTYILDGVSM